MPPASENPRHLLSLPSSHSSSVRRLRTYLSLPPSRPACRVFKSPGSSVRTRPVSVPAPHSAACSPQARSLTTTKRETDGGRFRRSLPITSLASVQPLGFALPVIRPPPPSLPNLPLLHSPAQHQTSRRILTRSRSLPGPIGERALATSCNPASLPKHTPAPRSSRAAPARLPREAQTTVSPSNRGPVSRLRQRLRVCVRVCFQRIPLVSLHSWPLNRLARLVKVDVVRSAHTLPPRTLSHAGSRARIR